MLDDSADDDGDDAGAPPAAAAGAVLSSSSFPRDASFQGLVDALSGAQRLLAQQHTLFRQRLATLFDLVPPPQQIPAPFLASDADDDDGEKGIAAERADFAREMGVREAALAAALERIAAMRQGLDAARTEAERRAAQVAGAVEAQRRGLAELRATAQRLDDARARWENTRRAELKAQLLAADREVQTLRGVREAQLREEIAGRDARIAQLLAENAQLRSLLQRAQHPSPPSGNTTT